VVRVFQQKLGCCLRRRHRIEDFGKKDIDEDDTQAGKGLELDFSDVSD
jgi:hypothetical protein